MRTFLIVDRLLNSENCYENENELFFRKQPEIFESGYVFRTESTKLMLGELNNCKELFRIRKIVNTSSQDVIDAFKLAFEIEDDFPKALAVYEEQTMETRE